MTVKSIPQMMMPPDMLLLTQAFSGTTAVSGANDKLACIFQAPYTGTINSINLESGAVTTGGNVELRVETLDASGNPSGTLWGTNTNATGVALPAANSDFGANLTANASVTKGDYVAIVCVNATSNFSLRKMIDLAPSALPYSARQASGTWTKQTSTLQVAIYDGTRYWNVSPVTTFAGVVATPFNQTSSVSGVGNGNWFESTIPFRVTGAYAHINAVGASNTFKIRLYEGTTAVMDLTVNPVARQANSTGQYFWFPSTYVLKPNLRYRIMIEPTSNNAVGVDSFYWQAPGNPAGLTWGASTGPSAGVFTDDTTVGARQICEIGIIVDGVDVPVIGASY